MYNIEYTNRFKKDVKLCKKRGYDIEELRNTIKILVECGKLPEKFKPHILSGDKSNIWECHIKSDWLLLWKQDNNTLTLLMYGTGTHSDLFGKTIR